MAIDTPNPSEATPEREGVLNAAVEREARLQGWVPEDQFRGNPDDWVEAETFVKRGREINPILRANNKRLMDRVEEIARQNQELRTTLDAFGKHHEDTAAKAYKAALATLRKEKKEAIESGDATEALKLSDQIEELKEAQAEAKETAKPIPRPAPISGSPRDPELISWTKENDWFGENKVKTQLTLTMGEELHAEFPELRGRPFLDELEARLAQEFPTRFAEFGDNPRRTAAPLTSDDGRPMSNFRRGRGKSFSDLPAEAQAACNKFVKQKLLTKEAYLKDYFGDEYNG